VNVGLIIYGSLDTVTGGYLYDRKIVEFLQNRGDRVEIFSQTWRGYVWRLLDNVSIRSLRALRSARLDVLVQDELNHPSLFLLNRRLRGNVRLPVVSIVHHLRCSELRPAWQNRLYQAVERHYLGTVDGFVFNSQTTRNAVEALIGRGKPAVVAYPGCDNLTPELAPGAIEDRAMEPGPLRVLFVGSLIPRKNLHTLVEALSTIQKDAWHLDVVGSLTTDPAYSNAIRKLIKRFGLEGRIDLLGPLTGAGLAAKYASSHVLAVPSSYEGFGIVYVEGMGFGLPALASTTGAAGEIVTHGQDGFLTDPDDAKALAEHIRALCSDRQKLARMSLAAIERYRVHPTWSQCGAQVADFLGKMVK